MAEGSFYAQIVNNATSALGSRVIVAFDISQELCEIATVTSIQRFLGCGTVVNSHRQPSLRVQSRADLLKYIFVFFDKYPLLGSKRHRLFILKEIVGLMENNKPLTQNNLIHIASLISKFKETTY